MRRLFKSLQCFLCFGLLASMLASCGKEAAVVPEEPEVQAEETPKITIGFSQLGAESDWRSMNTESMLSTFSAELGYNLIYENGQQKQANQITAIRKFIQQDVDYIVLAPVTETGWDTVLEEAKNAGIPVILMDRRVDVQDEELFTCWIGSDFEVEGRKACEWLHRYAQLQKFSEEDLHIVNIQGTLGATAQLGRTRGLQDAAKLYSWDLLEETTGDFTQTKGKEVMTDLLKKYDTINVVYCENDNEAFGVIEAIEESGRKVGCDLAGGEILVLSFDGVSPIAINDCLEGKIACIAECNPLLGSRVQTIIEELEAGKTPEKFEYVSETLFSAVEDITEVEVDGVSHAVTVLNAENVEKLNKR
ncbi:MAG: ABC transporter substrate-binding protein [Eubacteriales bacterium]|nr:ABC transporter substrate-binding protein [Eubacteriales bacterium]